MRGGASFAQSLDISMSLGDSADQGLLPGLWRYRLLLPYGHPDMDPAGSRSQDSTTVPGGITSNCSLLLSSPQFCLSSLCTHCASLSRPFLHHLFAQLTDTRGLWMSGVIVVARWAIWLWLVLPGVLRQFLAALEQHRRWLGCWAGRLSQESLLGVLYLRIT